VVSTKAGEANLRRVSVTLPEGQLLDNAHIGTVCTKIAFAQRTCPPGSRIGQAEAISPALDQPLKGPVYLRSSVNRLPDMVIDLTGQIDVELVGRVDSVKGRLRTSFAALPDAPITSFALNLLGGSKGLVINSETLCGNAKRAIVRMIGQNGARYNTRPRLQTKCGARAREQRHRRHHRRLRINMSREVR
jgi:hypothetical protein